MLSEFYFLLYGRYKKSTYRKNPDGSKPVVVPFQICLFWQVPEEDIYPRLVRTGIH
jgi:hypothetical protein